MRFLKDRERKLQNSIDMVDIDRALIKDFWLYIIA